jgi:hypothetical protein
MKTTMKRLIARSVTMAAITLLIAGPAAIAQTGGGTSRGASQSQSMREAPIGHRQPRADQLPSEKDLSDPNSRANKEDLALDRKIKSICRGC